MPIDPDPSAATGRPQPASVPPESPLGSDETPLAGDTTRPSSGLQGLTDALGLEAAGTGVDPLPGMVVGGVRIVRLIGEGGMGRVYEGWQEQPARQVAVKVMRPGIASAAALRRFRREAEILGQLDHPGIARIFAAGSFDLMGTSLPYYVMEFLPAAQNIVAAVAGLALADRLAVFAQVCDAVACGHARGVVHRDLKPANILVDAAGRPRVIDFGVARWRDEAAGPMTVTGQLVGTLQYISPEQCAARPDAVDARADVYSLGVVLHELLTGQPPYAVRDLGPVEAARVVCERVPPPPSRLDPRIPGRIDRLVGRCLRKAPAARFADAAELAAAIRDTAGGPGPSRRAWLAAGATGLVVAAALAWRSSGGVATPHNSTTTFDLREPPGKELVRTTNARIYREPFGAVTYWAPIRQREWAEVVYRLDSSFPVATVELDRFGVDAWNLHNDVPFDPEAAVHLEISPDGETWTEVMSSTPAGGRKRNDAFAAAVRGARQVFFRARLYETNSWNRNQVHRAQFLRSEPDLGGTPSVTLADRPR